jgi:hypothetical protein
MSSDHTLNGAERIAAERARQIAMENYSLAHDSEHDDEQLLDAALCYIDGQTLASYPATPPNWPWEASSWKPTPDDRVRELVKAAALIAAEIDRMLARDAR